jgi:hypothetical protein
LGGGEEWSAVISSAEDNRETYCKALQGKPLYGAYTMTLNDLKKVLKTSASQEEGFKEVRRWKRHNTEAAACSAKKAAIPTSSMKVTKKELLSPWHRVQHLRNQFQENPTDSLQ